MSTGEFSSVEFIFLPNWNEAVHLKLFNGLYDQILLLQIEQVKANDEDINENAQIEYSIVSGADDKFFIDCE